MAKLNLDKITGGGSKGAVDTKSIKADSGRLMKADPNIILPNPDQTRTKIDPVEYENIKASIAEDGMDDPLLVEKDGNRIILIAGQTRLKAVKELRWKEVEVLVYEGKDAFKASLNENLRRSGLNVMQKGEAGKKYSEKYGVSIKETAEFFKLSRTSMSHYIGLTKLPEIIKDEARGNWDLTLTDLLTTIKIGDPDKQLEFFLAIVERRKMEKIHPEKFAKLRKEGPPKVSKSKNRSKAKILAGLNTKYSTAGDNLLKVIEKQAASEDGVDPDMLTEANETIKAMIEITRNLMLAISTARNATADKDRVERN